MSEHSNSNGNGNGNGNGDIRPLILERPERQTFSQRWGSRGVTALAWAFWVYLVLPLVSLIAWILGLGFLYVVLLQGLSVDSLEALLLSYGVGVAVLVGIYLLWALYSYLRFRNKTRRQNVRVVQTHELAQLHGIEVSRVQAWRAARREVVDEQTLEQMFERRRENDGKAD